jgi:hypothetical protein
MSTIQAGGSDVFAVTIHSPFAITKRNHSPVPRNKIEILEMD